MPEPAEPQAEVQAAGGVVSDSLGRLLLVHRPRYDDWTFPKGKLDPGETLEECALREVEEETGLRCRLGEHLIRVGYTDHKGRTKSVDYWSMTLHPDVGDASFVPNDEVDEIRWLAPDEVRSALTYDRDREVMTVVGR